LIDATSEYRDLAEHAVHYHMGSPVHKASTSVPSLMPPASFDESDFIALFEPSGKVQGPKLREAIRSLRLARLLGNDATLVEDGLVKKAGRNKRTFTAAMKEHFAAVENPRTEFDVLKLEHQLNHECVRDGVDGKWGDTDENALTWCLPLRTRIAAI